MKRITRVCVSITDDDLRLIDRLAADAKVSRSELLRRAAQWIATGRVSG